MESISPGISCVGSLTEDIPLDLIDDNRFNSRLDYDKQSTRTLALSLQRDGLFSHVRVRKKKDRYELVYGHRRVQAARLLGWDTIKADVSTLSDEEMLKHSLLENLERKDLSDFERSLSILRMHKEFGKTYDEIAVIIGCSKNSNISKVSNIVIVW